MFKRLFGSPRSANRAIIEALYSEIVAAARQPALYTRCQTPDTPLGRFEMVSLHTFLVLERLGKETGAAREVAQDLTDCFFADLENSLRELGIGDLGVPKRMKKLARMFFGRTLAYRSALAARDRTILADALVRNVRPGEGRDLAAEMLADYVLETQALLDRQDAAAMLAGRVALAKADAGKEAVS